MNSNSFIFFSLPAILNFMDTTNPTAQSLEPQYRTLGKKTFLLFVLDHLKLPVIMLVVAVVLLMLGSGPWLVSTAVGNIAKYLEAGGLIALIVFGVSLLTTVMDAWLSYSTFQFALGENALMLKSGIIAKKETAIPYRQIQDITVEQNIAHRILGMSRLVILTAGHDEDPKDKGDNEGILPALDTTMAEQLQAELLKRTSVQKVTETSS